VRTPILKRRENVLDGRGREERKKDREKRNGLLSSAKGGRVDPKGRGGSWVEDESLSVGKGGGRKKGGAYPFGEKKRRKGREEEKEST